MLEGVGLLFFYHVRKRFTAEFTVFNQPPAYRVSIIIDDIAITDQKFSLYGRISVFYIARDDVTG